MSNYLNFAIKSRDNMKDWVLRQLGYPLIQVEITEDQLDDCINDSVEEFTKYVIQEQKFLALNLEEYPSTSGYTLPDNVQSIFAVDSNNLMGANSGPNVLFSARNLMWDSGYYYSGGVNQPDRWITYELAKQTNVKLSTANKFLQKMLTKKLVKKIGGYSGHYVYVELS